MNVLVDRTQQQQRGNGEGTAGINERGEERWLEQNVLLSGWKDGRRGSTESTAQLSAVVIFNWISMGGGVVHEDAMS